MAAPPVPTRHDTPAPPAPRRQKKNVLIPFGGATQLAANQRLFEFAARQTLLEPSDNVFVFHYNKRAPAGAAAGAGPLQQRPGFTLIPVEAPRAATGETADVDGKPVSDTAEGGATAAAGQGLTLVHYFAQRKHFLGDRGCI